jgi:hypothetical protein
MFLSLHHDVHIEKICWLFNGVMVVRSLLWFLPSGALLCFLLIFRDLQAAADVGSE